MTNFIIFNLILFYFIWQIVVVRKRVDPRLLPWLTMGSFYVRLQRYDGKLHLASWYLSICLHGKASLPLDVKRKIWCRVFLLKYVDQIQIFVQNRMKVKDSLQKAYVQLWYLGAYGMNARNTVNDIHIMWRRIGGISVPRNYGIITDTVVIFNIHCFVLDCNSVIWLHIHSMWYYGVMWRNDLITDTISCHLNGA
jgi:hypothetical protein